MGKIDFKQLEKKIGYLFKDKDLLKEALTHKTYAFEADMPLEYNERLEFLGDSILNFIVAEQLYTSNRYFSEGELTRRRAIGVNNNFFAKMSKKLDIGKYLLLGKGEKKQDGANNNTNLAKSLEALIGAIYLDSNVNIVREFILNKIFNKKFKF